MELKVHNIQKYLLNQQMLPKREKIRKKIINSETECFAEILYKQINKMKRGF